MHNLWLDLGNTRLKYWITDNNAQLIEHAAELHLQSPADLLLGLSSHFLQKNIENIGISSVLDATTNHRVANILHKLKAPIYFAQVHRHYAQLNTDYEQQQLGIDRWLQVLAMSKQTAQYCIVGCGTALTIDLLDGYHHLGGYILPSLYLQRDALTQGTKGIKIPQHAFQSLAAGQNTSDAVHHGILLGLLGAIQSILEQYTGYQLILTGGDAELFARHLVNYHPTLKTDLLLEGLQHYVAVQQAP